MVSAALFPLHDPVRIAEQIAVIDNAFPGRLITVAGAGYRVDEFAMADVDHASRGKLLEEYVSVILQAWTTDSFEWRGRTISVTPKPASQPHPPLIVGGGVPAAARRAARLRLPMLPMNDDPRVAEAYYEEAKRIGFDGGFVMVPEGPAFVHVTPDPDKAWAEIGEYLLYETRTYASYQTKGQHSLPMVQAESVQDLRRAAQMWVGTPDEILERAQGLSPMGALNFNPLAGGLPPDLAWPSLELFAREVLPRLRTAG
jgi:alkanesulfonate monooxygenase SsuD/methylene tetrahydromethanopterin reductase-like flavin-dependent oxidoreductase (luciferase family)